MIYLYFQPFGFRAAVAVCHLVTCAVGVVVLISKIWTHFRIERHAAEAISETACLLYTFSACVMSGRYMNSFGLSVISESFYPQLRAFFPVIIAAVMIFPSVLRKKPVGVAVLVSSLLIGTWSERFFGELFPYTVLLSAVILCVRNSVAALTGVKAMRSRISRLSIKDAIDTLPTGIMLYEADGRPLLVNGSFREFAEKIGGTLDNGGNAFGRYVYFENWTNGAVRHTLASHPVAELADGRVFMFSSDIITIRGRHYFQMTASEITERWKINETLESRREQLSKRSRELAELLRNVNGVCRDREIVAARGRVHDVLGQRITIFQRYLNSGVMPSRQSVSELVDDLYERMCRESLAPPEKRLADLCEMLNSVGVTVEITGELPKSISVAEVFFRVIREASTNSVRHAFATVVYVTFGSDKQYYTLCVSDNGRATEGEIIYGTGIKGMRQNVVESGGIFETVERPHFTVKAYIPRTETAR